MYDGKQNYVRLRCAQVWHMLSTNIAYLHIVRYSCERKEPFPPFPPHSYRIFIYLVRKITYSMAQKWGTPHFSWLLRATFHYSSQLQPAKTWFSTRFSTSSCGFATCFRPAFDFFVENLVAKLLHQSRHVEIDAAGSQQVRWFMLVLDKWNVEKKPF